MSPSRSSCPLTAPTRTLVKKEDPFKASCPLPTRFLSPFSTGVSPQARLQRQAEAGDATSPLRDWKGGKSGEEEHAVSKEQELVEVNSSAEQASTFEECAGAACPERKGTRGGSASPPVSAAATPSKMKRGSTPTCTPPKKVACPHPSHCHDATPPSTRDHVHAPSNQTHRRPPSARESHGARLLDRPPPAAGSGRAGAVR